MIKYSPVSETALETIFDSLNRKIVELKMNYKVVKVGISSQNPQACFQEHLSHGKWKRFIVLYQDSSKANVHYIKQQLNECHFFDHSSPNKTTGFIFLILQGHMYMYY